MKASKSRTGKQSTSHRGSGATKTHNRASASSGHRTQARSAAGRGLTTAPSRRRDDSFQERGRSPNERFQNENFQTTRSSTGRSQSGNSRTDYGTASQDRYGWNQNADRDSSFRASRDDGYRGRNSYDDFSSRRNPSEGNSQWDRNSNFREPSYSNFGSGSQEYRGRSSFDRDQDFDANRGGSQRDFNRTDQGREQERDPRGYDRNQEFRGASLTGRDYEDRYTNDDIEFDDDDQLTTRYPVSSQYAGADSEGDLQEETQYGLNGEDSTNDYDYETEQDRSSRGRSTRQGFDAMEQEENERISSARKSPARGGSRQSSRSQYNR